MALTAGSRLGSYEITALLGKGGMGEVYRARDLKLKREVAIKILPDEFSRDRDRASRFQREAEVLASLNHPNIAGIYDLAETEGSRFLVLELVAGETLSDRIARGAIPIDETLNIAKGICEGLEAAHGKGIIHRDLKPANIKITTDGQVKVLDFGLAKIAHSQTSGDAAPTAMQTLTQTAAGSILGTLPYMSPEQIEGQEADARSDIFAFGVVLYELIAGRRPFTGTSQTSLIASILGTKPQPLHELQPLTPAGLADVVQTCLEKDPEKRWQSAREVKHALKWISTQAPSIAARATKPRLWQGVAALLTLITVSLLAWMFWSKSAPEQISRLEASLPQNVTLYGYVSVSPDGRKLAFASSEGGANSDGLWIRDLGSPEWRRLPGTDLAASPFWSPDSRYIAFSAGNQLKKIDIAGGPPQTLCTMPARIEGSGSWNREGVIIFGSWSGGAGGPLWMTSETGSAPTALTEVDAKKGELYHTWPSFTEDGEHFIYFRSGTSDVQGIYVGSIHAKPAQQPRDRILATEYAASFANGYLFFVRAGTLLAQPLDPRSLKLKGETIPVAESLEVTWFHTGVFWASSGGVLTYRRNNVSLDLQLTWLDRQGKVVRTMGQPGRNHEISLSPDATRAIVRDAFYNTLGDLWMVDLVSGRRARFTFSQSNYSPAVWSPDGSRVAYAGGNLGHTIYEKASSGVGEEKILLKEAGVRHYPTSWSRDGRFLLYTSEYTPGTGADLWVLPLEGDHKPTRLLGEAFNEWASVFSPDARWIAYASTETGGGNIFVRPFIAAGPSGVPAVGQGKWQVSKDGGNWPRWVGTEIFFNDIPSGTTEYAARVKAVGDAFEHETPERLFAGPRTGLNVSPDGQRFLWAVPQGQQDGQVPISVVLNWPALMKK
jgi:serine/threonine protein kinase